MYISPVEYVFAGAWVLQTLSAAVSAMPKPKVDGKYSFFYKFIHIMTNNLDNYFEHKYQIAMPRVVDQSATQTIAADGSTQTTLAKTTITDPNATV